MFAVLGKLRWFFVEEKKRYVVAILLLIFGGILEILPPKLIGDAIDAIQHGRLSGNTLAVAVAGYMLLLLLTYGLNYIWMYRLFGGAHLVERKLRSAYMAKLLTFTPGFYERSRTGDLMARATNDLKAISQTAGFGILTLIDSTVWMLTLLVTMCALISWKLTLAALLPLPIIAAVMRVFGQKIHERFTIAQDAFGQMNDGVLETVSGIRVVRAYVQERSEERRFAETTEDVYRKNMQVAKIDALFEPTVRVTVGASYMIGIGYGAIMVFQGDITLGQLVSFNVYLGMLIWPMFAIGELINIMQRGNASLDRVNETLHAEPDVTDSDALPEESLPSVPGPIVFERVTFCYPGSEQDQLVNVRLRLEQGQTLGIVGRTGSGKSTLLKQLLRQYPSPQQGTIRIGDTELSRIPFAVLGKWIGYVPQEQMLFSRTVEENIRFGKPNATDEELRAALRLASLESDIGFLPNGLDTMVGEKGVALSGGQKQRVSIARAVLADPPMLMLDDAMSAVDARTEAAIVDRLRSVRAGKTTLIATHRLSAVQHADLILVLDRGRVVEQGTHAELLARRGWYAEQYDIQQMEASLDA